MNAEEFVGILEKHDGDRGALIAMLEDIQAKHNYLPPDALKVVASETGLSLVDVYGVATFYKSFSLRPRGKHLCSICLGTACHVRGAQVIAEEFGRQLGTEPGQMTRDEEFTLETVNCLGACALGPIVVVDGRYFSKVNATRVRQIIRRAKAGLDQDAAPNDPRIFPVGVSCSRCNHTLMDPAHPIDGCPSIRVTVSFERQHGWLRLSSLYGKHTVQYEHEVPMGTVVDFFCPHCHAEMKGAGTCPTCNAPMLLMIVRRGGVVQICSRRGCREHRLDLGASGF